MSWLADQCAEKVVQGNVAFSFSHLLQIAKSVDIWEPEIYLGYKDETGPLIKA